MQSSCKFVTHSMPESTCLDNAPLGLPEYDISQAPMAGYYINATRQCQMTFGPYAKVAVEYADTKVGGLLQSTFSQV